ncbi:MAG: RNA polymerase sigma-70 factor [Saprospiraceae bacterium]
MANTHELDDYDLLRRLSDDDEAAMEVLFKRHYSLVSYSIYNLVKDPRTTEDLAQEVFMEIWKRRDSLVINTSLKAYLRRSAVNKTLNYLRDKKNWKNEELSEIQLNLSSEPGKTLEATELEKIIGQAIEQLPERCQLIFKLSRVEEKSYQEIADELNISVKTVENQIVKALRMLRDALRPYMDSGLLLLLWWWF